MNNLALEKSILNIVIVRICCYKNYDIFQPEDILFGVFILDYFGLFRFEECQKINLVIF